MRGLRRRGTVWWYRITKAGQTFEGSLQTHERRIAVERLEAIRREITGDRFGERHRTFDDAARRFVAEHFPTLRPSTRGRYLTSLSALTKHFAGVRLPVFKISRGRESVKRYQRVAWKFNRLGCSSARIARHAQAAWRAKMGTGHGRVLRDPSGRERKRRYGECLQGRRIGPLCRV